MMDGRILFKKENFTEDEWGEALTGAVNALRGMPDEAKVAVEIRKVNTGTKRRPVWAFSITVWEPAEPRTSTLYMLNCGGRLVLETYAWKMRDELEALLPERIREKTPKGGCPGAQ